ncbi:hypothetical protein ISF9_118 [Microbacterium phage vB_MoxS-ISF9]|uniref:Uncharacterized protein n=1 Tax=Microbacterium phage vB_MoxS-ISF9 TaxID=1458670 RepID=W8NWS0_9CAUD|nr:hypothetical protein ISF9_118 [Microbacterium phage vB_MoxS-ISF9]AHL18588.1 hypothetical protein ISF9_118 [Microbacterium phage vB_MoxS-ISF9]
MVVGLAAAPTGMWLAAWLYAMGERLDNPLYIEEARDKMKTGLLVGSMIGLMIIVASTVQFGPHTW